MHEPSPASWQCVSLSPASCLPRPSHMAFRTQAGVESACPRVHPSNHFSPKVNIFVQADSSKSGEEDIIAWA